MCNKWTDNQKQIYAGLKEIGGEASGYFESALTYYYDASLPNRVSHLAHDAREIDGGLRDIFSPDSEKKEKEQGLIQKGIDKIFGVELRKCKGHIASILVTLDVDEKDALAKEWISVATKFSKYAHRHGIWKEARSFEEFKPLWERYEEVLLKLVGSFYAIVNRIDRLIQLEEINKASRGALLNLIRIKPYEDYFFRKAKNSKWFLPLDNNNVFKPDNIQFDENGNALFWSVLTYLEQVSLPLHGAPQYAKNLISIINNTVDYSLHKHKLNNYRLWWFFVKILNNIPTELIIANKVTVEQFKTWLLEWVSLELRGDLAITDILEKLLPKFLEHKNTIEFAETIVEVVTRISKSGKRDSFTKKEEAVLVYSSYWILDAFRKYSRKIGEVCSVSAIYDLANKLKGALELKQKDYYSNLKIKNDIYQIQVARIEKESLDKCEICFKENHYDASIKQFAPEQLKDIDVENDFWALHNIEPHLEFKRFAFTASTKDLFIAAIKENLPEGIDWQAADKFEKRLSDIYEGLYSDYSHIWCRTLKSGPEHGDGAEEVLTVILRDILLTKSEANCEECKQVLNAFLSDKYQFPIFRRFVLLCVDKFWSDYYELLDKLIKVIPSILEESDLEVEMHDVFQHHNITFSPELKATIRELISNVPEYYVKKEDEKLIAYWKYKWLSSLRENPDFTVLYEKERQKAEPKDDKPYEPERSAFKGGLVTHKSPISKEEILKKPIAELVKQLSEFKGADFWHGAFEGEPDKEGFAEALRLAVKDEPNKFTDEISAFRDVNYFYLHSLFRGFSEAWNSNKELDWNNIFDFVLQYFSRGKEVILKEALHAQGEDSGKGKYIWLIEDVVDLIEDGSKDDKHAFDLEHFDTVKKIFNLVIPLLKTEKRPDTERDALTYALNTTFGRIIMSFIIFSLRVSRATKKTEQDWGKNNYERFFERGIEAYIWFGRYLPNLRYLDKDYVDNKIAEFYERDVDDYEWQMFMDGYLTMSHIYADIYQLMRPNYFKALQKKIASEHVDNRLVQHITIGYLGGDEELKKQNRDGGYSLFWKMLDEAGTTEKRDRWLEVVSYFWSISGRTIRKEGKKEDERLSSKERERVLEFWKWSCEEKNIEYVKTMIKEDYGSFLGRLAELTILLDRIDETAEKWLMLSAPFIDEDHRSGFFIEYLTKFDDEDSIKRIGRILLKVLEYGRPTFRQEEIRLLVKRIFKVGEKYPEIKDMANNICNTYGRHGIHFLKDIWAEYDK